MWKVFQNPGVFVARPDFQDPTIVADRLKAAEISWCAVNVLQGTEVVWADWMDRTNWPSILRSRGITFGLWGYHKTDPVAEAKLASDLIGHFDDPAHSTFYIADCEGEYTTSWGGEITRSKAFVQAFRTLRPSRPAALSSFGAAIWDFNLNTVFDYKPWQNNQFDFMPQAYFNQAAELEPAHCFEHALAAGWQPNQIHPTVGIYQDTLGRVSGDEYSYLLRNCRKRFNMLGWSLYNLENTSAEDLAALARVQ